jgi:hypothetical protein
VIDRWGQVLEEAFQGGGVVGVEGGGACGAEFLGRLLEPFGVTASEDDVGPFGLSAPGRLESDAGTAADQHDGLPEQFRLAPARRRRGATGHRGPAG